MMFNSPNCRRESFCLRNRALANNMRALLSTDTLVSLTRQAKKISNKGLEAHLYINQIYQIAKIHSHKLITLIVQMTWIWKSIQPLKLIIKQINQHDSAVQCLVQRNQANLLQRKWIFHKRLKHLNILKKLATKEIQKRMTLSLF